VNSDLFGAPTLIGLKVRLQRDIDRENPCHDNVAVIYPGKAQHAGELRCERCDAFRGWLPQSTRAFILETVRRFGAPPEPIIVRQQEQENKAMAFEQKDNSWALFRNDRKEGENDPDYKGSATIGGVEYWLNAWLRTSKAGQKYFSGSLKPKVWKGDGERKPVSVQQDLNDEVPF
jgi:hypothetical protein